jgi:dihydroflavonol-4-reductase
VEPYEPAARSRPTLPYQSVVISFLTGATGFVGSHVARKLVAHGDRVRALVRPSSNRQALQGLDVECVLGDLCDAASWRSALEGVQRVYHAAADYRLWATNPREIYQTNVEGTLRVLETARAAGVQRVVYTSTVGTLPFTGRGPVPNESTPACLEDMVGHYKRSKFLAEQEALSAARKGLQVVIVNPTAPVGPGDWKPTPTGRMIVDFLSGRVPAYVDTGLNLVAVEDVAEGHWLAAEHGRPGERYLLGGENMTLNEVFSVLAEAAGRRPPRWKMPHSVALVAAYAEAALAAVSKREPRIPLEGVRMARHTMFADDSKARSELGFCPGPAREALHRAAKWYQEHGYVR